MLNRIFFIFLLMCSAFLSFGKAFAVEFEVYQSSYKPLNIAILVSPVDAYSMQTKQLTKTIRNDLDASRSFKSMDPLGFLVNAKEVKKQLDYADWRIIGTDILVIASLSKLKLGWVVEVQIHSPFSGKLLASQNIEQDGEKVDASLGHRIADYIYHEQTGLPSYFASQIVFVHKNGKYSDLMMMGHDGSGVSVVGKGFDMLMSPDLSPDRATIVLSAFVNNRPRLELFDIKSRKLTSFTDFKGLKSTPEFSPDGRFIAATLSFTGNSEIHIYDIKNRKWTQFTFDEGIDTTPTWSPDGKWIAFTSNRDGTPQIYRKSVATGEVIKVSLDASYNTSPVWAPIGERLAFVTKKNWEYAIATVHIDGTGLRYLATGQRIESPTWSPNGQMVLYSAEENGKKHIYSVPIWGGEAKRLTPKELSAADPSWVR